MTTATETPRKFASIETDAPEWAAELDEAGRTMLRWRCAGIEPVDLANYADGLVEALLTTNDRAPLDEDTERRYLWALLCDHLNSQLAAVVCLLDNAEQGTYDTIAAVATRVLDEIDRQGAGHDALAELTREEVHQRADMLDAAEATRIAIDLENLGRAR